MSIKHLPETVHCTIIYKNIHILVSVVVSKVFLINILVKNIIKKFLIVKCLIHCFKAVLKNDVSLNLVGEV